MSSTSLSDQAHLILQQRLRAAAESRTRKQACLHHQVRKRIAWAMVLQAGKALAMGIRIVQQEQRSRPSHITQAK